MLGRDRGCSAALETGHADQRVYNLEVGLVVLGAERMARSCEVNVSNLVTLAIMELFEELANIAARYEELTDSDVREALHRTLNRFFVWGERMDRLPNAFGMFGVDRDRLVTAAIRRFLEAVTGTPELGSIPIGQARLDMLQDRGLRTTTGVRYDELIGHRSSPLPPGELPEHMYRDDRFTPQDPDRG